MLRNFHLKNAYSIHLEIYVKWATFMKENSNFITTKDIRKMENLSKLAKKIDFLTLHLAKYTRLRFLFFLKQILQTFKEIILIIYS